MTWPFRTPCLRKAFTVAESGRLRPGGFAGAFEVLDEKPLLGRGGQRFHEDFAHGAKKGRRWCGADSWGGGKVWGDDLGWCLNVVLKEEGADAADHFEVAGEFGFEFGEGVQV